MAAHEVGIESLNPDQLLFKAYIIHEISLDKTFVYGQEGSILEEVSFRGRVQRENPQDFWLLLESELSQVPPILTQAFIVLSDIKEAFKAAMMPYNKSLVKELHEILDIDLIMQQAEHEAIDVEAYVIQTVSLMRRMCSPARDDQVNEILHCEGVVTKIRKALEVLQYMKVDMINFQLGLLKPYVLEHHLELEKEYLVRYFYLNGINLSATSSWIRSFQRPVGAAGDFNQFLVSAYVGLLSLDDDLPFPEVLILDLYRFTKMRSDYHKISVATTIILHIMTSLGATLVLDIDNKKVITRRIMSALGENLTKAKLPGMLGRLADQIKIEMDSFFIAKGLDTESPNIQKIHSMITDHVLNAAEASKVRTIVETRLNEYLERSIKERNPPVLSSAMSFVEPEIKILASVLKPVIIHNASVFFESLKAFYDERN